MRLQPGDRVVVTKVLPDEDPDCVRSLAVGLVGTTYHYYEETGDYSHWIYVEFDKIVPYYDRKGIYIPDKILKSLTIKILPEKASIPQQLFSCHKTFDDVWKELVG